MVRSGSSIVAIFASTALSPSALSSFSSWTRSFMAARSSSVNPLTFLVVAGVRFLGLIETSSFVAVITASAPQMSSGVNKRNATRSQALAASLVWKTPQEVLCSGEVIVARVRVHLPLTEFRERPSLHSLGGNVCAVGGEHVVGEFGGPLELAGRQRVSRARQHLIGASRQADDVRGALPLRQGKQARGIAIEPPYAVGVDGAD